MKKDREPTEGNHIYRAIEHELDYIGRLTQQINELRKLKLDATKKNSLMVPVIEVRSMHRRRVNHILSEFDIELIPGVLSSAG